MIDQILFDKASKVDPFGRVFYANERVFRAISPESRDLCLKLLTNADKWNLAGLVRTRPTDLSLNGYAMVIEHQKISPPNYCLEWLPNMLKDAALKLVDMNISLLADGYMTKDSHPWNIFFSSAQPIFIDFGSIVPVNAELLSHWHREFVEHFLVPLRLFQRGMHSKAYEYMRLPYNDGQRAVLMNGCLSRFEEWLKPKQPERYFPWLRTKINTLRLAVEPMKWSSYDQKPRVFTDPDSFEPKQRVVYNLLQSLDKGTLLDIGCNNGWYSELAVGLGYSVIAIDNDIPSLERLYIKSRAENLPVLPLVVDFTHLTPAHGVDQAYPSFDQRTPSDVTLMLALVHHLVFSAGMNFEEIAHRVAKLTLNAAIVEFIPSDDAHVSQWDHTGRGWYTQEKFLTAFLNHFKTYEIFNSSPTPRKIFLFTK